MVVLAKAATHIAPYNMPQSVKWQLNIWWRLLESNQNAQSYEDCSLPIEINRHKRMEGERRIGLLLSRFCRPRPSPVLGTRPMVAGGGIKPPHHGSGPCALSLCKPAS